MAELYAKIAVSDVTYWVDRPYDYRVPDALIPLLTEGMRVTVPFSRNNRRAEGIVLGLSERCDCPPEKLKYVAEALDEQPVLTKEQLRLALWMRERFFCTVYDAVRSLLPAGLWFRPDGTRKAGDKQVTFVRLAIPAEDAAAAARTKKSRAPMQSAVLTLLSAVGEAAVEDVRELTGASPSSLKALEKAELVELFQKEAFRRPKFRVGERAPLPVLNDSQNRAFASLAALLDKETPEAALLFGVTGSGKTTVYIHLIRRALDAGKSAILLVPEIALTPQMLETFSSYFGDEIAVMHSSLSIAERYDEWKRAKNGSARLVIGTRSAVFAPASNLGLVIIDEEQEETYKSENAPRYHARDVAKYRCAETNSLLLLGSATPDLESSYAAETGRYHFFSLTGRYNQMALPEVRIVDMKRELRAGNDSSISSVLHRELEKNIAAGEQSILFLNRRGASKLITCVDCGFTYKCPNCSVSLTYHSANRRLMCHYCGHTSAVASACPDCGGELSFVGDGTQKVEQQLRDLFLGTEILRMDTDTVAKAGSHDALLSRFKRERIPIMIGTQMVTKGLNFEDVTLVGVLSADQSLYSGDYRAAERTFSLITQVIGRSGRASRPGRAVIQTFTPENQVIRCAAKQDYESFYRAELELRRVQKCPPFTQIIVISVSGVDERLVLKSCGAIREILERELAGQMQVNILGPAPYPVVRVNNKYRYRISLACAAGREVRALVSKLLIYCNTEKKFRGVSFYADMNPYD